MRWRPGRRRPKHRRAGGPCGQCGRALVPVVYGFPGHELWERAKRGEVVIGGCIPMDKAWACSHCTERDRSGGDDADDPGPEVV